jgi:chitin disaccharide deacetylase
MSAEEIIVCADDFALDERVNAGILRLVEIGRLSAVSCFTDAPSWRECGVEFRGLARRVYVGLHFNLTQPFGQGERSLPYWIASCSSRTVDVPGVRAHLQRQWDNFVAVVGRQPDFVDGHQHVHAFPIVRSLVHDFVAAVGHNDAVRIRAVSPSFGGTDAPFKRAVIHALANAGPQVTDRGMFLNTGFAGDYSLSLDADFERLFAGWLAGAPDRGLIMCHPALGPAPGAATARVREYRFLASARFAELLAAHGRKLAHPPDRFGTAERLTA